MSYPKGERLLRVRLFYDIYIGVWNMLRYCSDCTILISFSEHGPVIVLFLSVYLYGTIIANPHIRTERLLLILTFWTHQAIYKRR
jgi:hypothetical protein